MSWNNTRRLLARKGLLVGDLLAAPGGPGIAVAQVGRPTAGREVNYESKSLAAFRLLG